MKERPILFNGEMVRAILDGRKTQTRRIVKPRKLMEFDAAIKMGECSNFIDGPKHEWDDRYLQGLCPYGAAGDELWVRETHYRIPHGKPSCTSCYYEETDKFPILCELYDRGIYRKYPSIHMPRWASRIQLKITGILVERLQNISEDDAKAEGCCQEYTSDGTIGGFVSAKDNFKKIWDSINADKAPWESNPWVWVIEFEVIKK